MTSLIDTALRLTYSDHQWRQLQPDRPIAGVRYYLLSGPSRLIVTIGAGDELVDTVWGPCAEAKRLQWLKDRDIPCCDIADTGVLDGGQYLVARLPAGVPASAVWPRNQRMEVCDRAASAIRELHDLDIAGCPFDRRLKVTIPRAKEATVFAEVRASNPTAALTGLIAETMLAGREEPVVCHGDPRPSNVLIDPETLQVTALLDVSRLGLADRYTDLVAAGDGWRLPAQQRRFWYRYGEIPADPARRDLYRRLSLFV